MSINSNGKPLALKYFATDNPVLPNPIMMLCLLSLNVSKFYLVILIVTSMLRGQKGQASQLLSKIARLLSALANLSIQSGDAMEPF